MHFVDSPWGGVQLAFVQMSTCQEPSLSTFIKLLTGSQVVGKKHALSTKVCGLVSLAGWASVNRVEISNRTDSEAQGQLAMHPNWEVSAYPP